MKNKKLLASVRLYDNDNHQVIYATQSCGIFYCIYARFITNGGKLEALDLYIKNYKGIFDYKLPEIIKDDFEQGILLLGIKPTLTLPGKYSKTIKLKNSRKFEDIKHIYVTTLKDEIDNLDSLSIDEILNTSIEDDSQKSLLSDDENRFYLDNDPNFSEEEIKYIKKEYKLDIKPFHDSLKKYSSLNKNEFSQAGIAAFNRDCNTSIIISKP